MPSVIIEVTATPKPLPAGAVFAGYRYTVSDGKPNSLLISKDDPELSTRLDDLAAGTYTAQVWAMVNPAKPEPIGDPATGQFTVGDPGSAPQTYMAPTGLGFLVV